MNRNKNSFQVNIKCTNAAFHDDRNNEVARILRELADKLDNGYMQANLFDLNGNNVGSGDYI